MESKWLASLRQFLASIDSSFQLDKEYIPQLQREGDAHIMDLILRNGQYTNEEVKRLNYCRLYLQAQSLSDLTTTDGYLLDATKLQGTPSLQSSRTHQGEINQRRPAEEDWQLWREANGLWSDATGRLYHPLGAWILPIKAQRQRHAAYWTTTMLWVRVDDFFFDSQERSTWEEIDDGSYPADATYVSPGIWRAYDLGTFHRAPLTARATFFSPRVISPTFDHYIGELDELEASLLQHIELLTDPFSVGLALSNGLRGVSDGSVWVKRLGAFGWALSDAQGVRLVEGMGPAPGATPTSYRSEAYGTLAILCFLRRLREFTGQQSNPLTGILATDSLSLLDTLRRVKMDDIPSGLDDMPETTNAPLDPLGAEWDVVEKINSLLHASPKLVLKHVRGHQDRKVQYHRLSLLSQLNVDASKGEDPNSAHISV